MIKSISFDDFNGIRMKKINYRLDKADKTPLYLQLYQQIRLAIHQQQLHFGDKLPSKRHLSEFLQISQNTVENAYEQLLAEGYINAKARSGFFVSFQAELDFPCDLPRQKQTAYFQSRKTYYDLNPNLIDSKNFPIRQWQKAGKQSLKFWQNEMIALGDKQGDRNLRNEIAHYLYASRGVNCEPEQIVIGTGLENCVLQLILLFNQISEKPIQYAMESYGYITIEKMLTAYGKKVLHLPLTTDGQLDLATLAESRIDVAYLTPSNLYPFSQVLSIGQRQQLLEWANQQPQRYIIEDDYDSEYRYKGKPIPALQSLDVNEKVIYLGSFSKLLMPSLRVGFMVLPKSLLSLYQEYCGFFNCGVSRFEQQRLATFIQQGEFEKHIQRMRKIYRKKMEMLCRLLQPYSHKIRYYGEHSGSYLLIELLEIRHTNSELVERCLQKNIRIYPLNYPNRQLFSIGFANIDEQEFNRVFETLISVLE